MCETEIIDCVQIIRSMCIKGRKETTHERVGERKTYINIKKEISTMYVYKWSQDLMYKNNVSIKEKKEKIHNILTTSLNTQQHSP